jgi:hypothetical protein
MIAPMLCLIAWSLFMLVWLYVTRLPAFWRLAVLHSPADVRRLSPQAQWPADNYHNLMEQPTLFYALCVAMHLYGLGDADTHYLAWLYVALRVLHSIVQATSNITVIRFCLFLAGSGVLCGLCAMAIRDAFI